MRICRNSSKCNTKVIAILTYCRTPRSSIKSRKARTVEKFQMKIGNRSTQFGSTINCKLSYPMESRLLIESTLRNWVRITTHLPNSNRSRAGSYIRSRTVSSFVFQSIAHNSFLQLLSFTSFIRYQVRTTPIAPLWTDATLIV